MVFDSTSSSSSSSASGDAELKKWNRLRIWHWILFGLHVLAAITLAILVSTASNDTPVPLDLYRHKLIQVPGAGDEATSAPTYKYEGEKVATLSMPWLIGLFFGVTAVAHLYYATNAFGTKLYESHVRVQGQNPVRWIEYGISATIMIIIIATLSGVKDFDALLFIIFGTVVVMGQGAIVEHQVAVRGAKWNDATVWQSTAIGWAMLTLIFVVIMTNFSKRLNEVDSFGIPIPKWLIFVSLPMIAWFASFGIVQLVQLIKGGAYIKYEFAYTVLSLASKLFLGIWVAVGFSQRSANETNPTVAAVAASGAAISTP